MTDDPRLMFYDSSLYIHSRCISKRFKKETGAMTEEQRQVIYDGALYAHLQSKREDYAVAWGCYVAGAKNISFFDALDVVRDALKKGRSIILYGKNIDKTMESLRRKYDR